MYLTRFTMDPAHRGARRLLGSPHAMHAAVRGAFAAPEDYEQPGGRTLWRIDTTSGALLHLYIVSPGRPDLTHLVQQAGQAATEPWTTRGYGPLLDSLSAGQRWAFRLAANPVHSGRKTADAKETQRFGHLRPAEQTTWLLDRAERCGFSVAVQQDGEPNVKLRRSQTVSFKRGMGTVTLTTATYDGALDIVDAELFRQAMTHGIGHGKAYGCGLLTIAPLGV